jgi:putative DNA primase/helicase
MDNIGEHFRKYHSGMYGAMARHLAASLDVKPEAIEQLGVGFDYRCQAWVFADRNVTGEVIGLSYRYEDGRKGMSPDYKGKQKRGLVYPLNQDYGKGVNKYVNGQHNWSRVADVGVMCPVCGKPDGCLVSADCPDSPSAAICIRPQAKEGAAADLGQAGYLHVFKKSGNHRNGTVLPESSLPVLVVEGASDVLAAMSMGYVAIGKPGASAGLDLLSQMPLAGREVWIIGENDAGAGREGMEKTFAALRTATKLVRMVMPPAGIKDLRAWYATGLNPAMLADWVSKHTEEHSIVDDGIFPDGQPATIARAFFGHGCKLGNGHMLRNYRGEWYVWKGGRYLKLEENRVRGLVYEFIEEKSFVRETANGGRTVVPIPTTRNMAGDILACTSMPELCPIVSDPPCWLTRTDMPNPKDLIAFKNGILDVKQYMEGKIVLYDPSPDLFIMNTLPYAYDEDAQSQFCIDYYASIFNGDKEIIRLLAQWFGYNAVPDTSQEKMMILTGRPRSGKSTTLDMLHGMLGTEQCCSLKMRHLIDRFGRQPMLGKLSAIFADTKNPRASEASSALETLLAIVGQDRVSVDRKGIAELPDVKLFCRFTMAMNDIPAFSDHARAFAPRVNIISYPNTYVGHEDRGLKGKLEEEAKSGKLINWALQGLKDLRTRGRFTEPVSSMKTLRALEYVATPMLLFAIECCVMAKNVRGAAGQVPKDRIREDGSIRIMKDELYAAWRVWNEARGTQAGVKEQFSRYLLDIFPELKTARMRLSRDEDKHAPMNYSDRTYYFIGIDLTDEARRQYIV